MAKRLPPGPKSEIDDETPQTEAESETPVLDIMRMLLKTVGRELKKASETPDEGLDEMAQRRKRRSEIYEETESPSNGDAIILKFEPPPSLADNFSALYPDKQLPDFSVLSQLGFRIDAAFHETAGIDHTAPKKHLKFAQRNALAEGARELFTTESLMSTHKYLLGLYARILLFCSNFTEGLTSKLINPETFEVLHDPMEDLVEIIKYMQDAYPVVCRELMMSSEIVKTLMLGRIDALKEQKRKGTEPKPSDFQKNTREYAKVAMVNSEAVIRGAQLCNSDYVVGSLATALETGLFAITHIAADNLAPAFVKRPDGKYAFEAHFPFKLDFILAASSCIMTLMPQLRLQIANISRINTITNGLRTEN